MRLRILELLGSGERTVGELQEALSLDSSGTSQQLAVLRQHGLLDSRKSGTNVYYRARDDRITQLLELGNEILSTALADAYSLLIDLSGGQPPAGRLGAE